MGMKRTRAPRDKHIQEQHVNAQQGVSVYDFIMLMFS